MAPARFGIGAFKNLIPGTTSTLRPASISANSLETSNRVVQHRIFVKRYCRVMSAGVKLAFEKVGKVNLNREEWGIYPPRSVVFLFALSAASHKHLNSFANYHMERRDVTSSAYV